MRLTNKRKCLECENVKAISEFKKYKEGKRTITSSICNNCFNSLEMFETDEQVDNYLKDNPINRKVVKNRLLTEIAQNRADCERTNGV